MEEQANGLRGWIKKRGRKRKSWKKRFFVLSVDGTSLCYYTNESCTKKTLKGSISLNKGSYTEIKDEEKHLFVLFSGGRELWLQTESENSLKLWIEGLNKLSRKTKPAQTKEEEIEIEKEKERKEEVVKSMLSEDSLETAKDSFKLSEKQYVTLHAMRDKLKEKRKEILNSIEEFKEIPHSEVKIKELEAALEKNEIEIELCIKNPRISPGMQTDPSVSERPSFGPSYFQLSEDDQVKVMNQIDDLTTFISSHEAELKQMKPTADSEEIEFTKRLLADAKDKMQILYSNPAEVLNIENDKSLDGESIAMRAKYDVLNLVAYRDGLSRKLNGYKKELTIGDHVARENLAKTEKDLGELESRISTMKRDMRADSRSGVW